MVEPAALDNKMHRGERACVPTAKSNFLSVETLVASGAALSALLLARDSEASPITIYSFREMFQQEFPLANQQQIWTDEGNFSLYGNNNTTTFTTTLLSNSTGDPAGYVNSFNMGNGSYLGGYYIDKNAFWGLNPTEKPVDAVTIVKSNPANEIGTYDAATNQFAYSSANGGNTIISGAQSYIIDSVPGNFAGLPDYQTGGDMGIVNFVPEPVTSVMMLAGLGALVAGKRVRKSVKSFLQKILG